MYIQINNVDLQNGVETLESPFINMNTKDVISIKFVFEDMISHYLKNIICLSSATDLFTVVKERRLEEYVAAYLKKRLLNMHKSDLGGSLFINECVLLGRIKK